ncbi:MAG: GFA family protein [Alteromonadaceae bacterium]|nr:GFA family protein [Alteromonadaceae bacterium]
MTNIQQGGCRCGFARYEIDLSGANTLNCHCIDCQKHLGAPFSVFTVVPASQFKWLKKPVGFIAFSDTANRIFCNKCGTYLKWEGVTSSNEAEINAMTLDDPSSFKVDEEIFVRTRISWLKPLEGVPQYEAGRTVEEGSKT